MHVQDDVPLFRVDAVVEERYIPPDEDNCIEMECFDLPKWESNFDQGTCCVDYDFDNLQCVSGTATKASPKKKCDHWMTNTDVRQECIREAKVIAVLDASQLVYRISC